MEWLTTDVIAPSTGPVTATVIWRDPTKEFMDALSMSALSKLPMPIPSGPADWTMNGYVTNYSWQHETSIQFDGKPAMRYVVLTVRFVVTP